MTNKSIFKIFRIVKNFRKTLDQEILIFFLKNCRFGNRQVPGNQTAIQKNIKYIPLQFENQLT